jgi:hypothetical protein
MGGKFMNGGAFGNSFDSTFTKGLMQQKDIDLGWVIAITS